MARPAQSSTDRPDLIDLIERLRRAGFRPDPRQYIAAHEVLLGLAARGATADFSEARAATKQGESARAMLASHLGLVFCTAPEQQAAFAEIFRQWLRKDGAAQVDDPGRRIEEERRRVLDRQRRRRRIGALVIAALALFGAGLAAWRYAFGIRDLEIRVAGLNPQPSAPDATIPLPQAEVTYSGGTVPLDGSASGHLLLRRFDGDVAITVAHPGYEPRQLTVDADYASPLGVDLQRPPSPPGEEPGSTLRLGKPETISLPDISPPPVVERNWPLAAGAAAAAGVATLLGLTWIERRRRRSVLQRIPAEGRSDLESLRLDTSPLAPLGSRELRRLIGALRRQRELETRGLDIDRTVAATARAAGLFTPVFSAQRRMPEYLVLCERRSADDHCYRLVESLLDPLARNGVPLERYDFSGDPCVCRRADNALRQSTLGELALTHHSAVLFVFAETETFFDPLSGDLLPWVESLGAWHSRVFFTFQPPYVWNEREQRLAETGSVVLPATREGLRAYGEIGAEGGSRHKERPPYARRYPAILAGSVMRWLERDAPAAGTIETLLVQLRSYLGPSGFDWLAACAVYPQVSWPLTLDLAAAVHPARSTAQEFASSVLPSLARLPWFRHAYLPDWLRRTLLRQLGPEAEERIRAQLDTLLSRAGRRHRAPGLAEEHTLDITAAEIVATSPPDSPMRDAVFIGFTSGTTTPDLAVLAPRPLVRLFRRLRRLPTPEEQKIAAPARSWRNRLAAMLQLFWRGYPWLARGIIGLTAAVAVGGIAALLTTRENMLSGPQDGFCALALTDGGPLAAGISGNAIKIWARNAADSFPAGLSNGPDFGASQFTALALSPDGGLVFGTKTGASGGSPLRPASEITKFEPGQPVTAVAAGIDSFASANQLNTGSDIILRIFDEQRTPDDRWNVQRVELPRRVRTIALDPGNQLLAVGLEQGAIHFRRADLITEAAAVGDIGDIEAPDALAMSVPSPGNRAVTLPQWIAVAAGQQLSLYEISTGKLLAQIDAGGPIRATAFNGAGDQVGALTDASVTVWPIIAQQPDADVQQMQQQRRINPPPQEPRYEANAADTSQREPTAPPVCADIVDIRKLGSAKESPAALCRKENFDGYFSVAGAGYCYRGDLEACRRQIRPPATAP